MMYEVSYCFYSCVQNDYVCRFRIFEKKDKNYKKFIKLLELNNIKYEVNEI